MKSQTPITAALKRVTSSIDGTGYISTGPVSGSFSAMATSILSKHRNLLFVTAHLDDADETVAMLQDLGIQAVLFPALETEVAKDIIASRYALLESLTTEPPPEVIVASVPALLQKTPAPDASNPGFKLPKDVLPN